MTDIKRADYKAAAIAILNPWRLLGLAFACYLGYMLTNQEGLWFYTGLAIVGVGIGLFGAAARLDFLKRRFRNPDHKRLWDIVEDRLIRMRNALKRVPPHIRSSLDDLTKNVDKTSNHLYRSLRRADIVKDEIMRSEGPVATAAFPFQVSSPDAETNELYVIADKNVAEYRRHFQGIAARVTRVEGQCAVFISALDSLRVQLLGHRLTADDTVSKQDFLETMNDIKSQLASINRALSELDLPVSAQTHDQTAAKLEQGPR